MIGALLVQRQARQAFKALNRRDLEGFMENWADEAAFTFPGHAATSGTSVGKSSIATWFNEWWERVPFFRFTVKHVAVERVLALGGTNNVTIEWELVERDRDGRSYRFEGVTAVQARGGKIVRARDYFFDPDPLVHLMGRAPETVTTPLADPVPAGR